MSHTDLSPDAKALLITMIEFNYERALRRNPRLQISKTRFIDDSLAAYDIGLLKVVKRGMCVGLEPAR